MKELNRIVWYISMVMQYAMLVVFAGITVDAIVQYMSLGVSSWRCLVPGCCIIATVSLYNYIKSQRYGGN